MLNRFYMSFSQLFEFAKSLHLDLTYYKDGMTHCNLEIKIHMNILSKSRIKQYKSIII